MCFGRSLASPSSRPVARIVTFASSPRASSVEIPHITSMFESNWSKKSSISCISRTKMGLSSLAYILKSIRLALPMSLPWSSGESRALRMAFSTRCSPLALPMAMMAPPPSFIVVSTSRKSRSMPPSECTVISSEMPFTASPSMLSALLKASFTEMSESPYTSHSRSLFTMSSASTFRLSSSTPFSAWMIFLFFSK